MDGDFGTYVKYFLSILIGVCCVGGSIVCFNYDKFEDPRKIRKQFIIGLSMMALGLGVATAYNYARENNKLPEFLTKTEGQKQADKQIKKEKAEQEAKDKESASSKAESTDGDGENKATEPLIKTKPGEKVFAVKHMATQKMEDEVSAPSPDIEDNKGEKSKTNNK